MPAFCARWPDGSFSIIDADDETDARIQLDELGDEPADLWAMESCLLDFELTDSGTFRLTQFGERTAPEILERAYPVLNKTLESESFADQPIMSTPSIQTVVLVHLALEDSSLWAQGVIQGLQRDACPVEVFSNPLRGVAVDTACMRSVLNRIEGPVILVSHASYCGAVITETGDDPNSHVIELNSSHAIPFTFPDVVVNVIKETAHATPQGKGGPLSGG